MKFDKHLVTGIFIGTVLGLHYAETLIMYLPVLTIVTLILVLKTVHR